MGALASSAWGMASAFLVTAGLYAAMAAMVTALVKVPAAPELAEEDVAERVPEASVEE